LVYASQKRETDLKFAGRVKKLFSRFTQSLILTRRDVRGSYLSGRVQAENDFADS